MDRLNILQKQESAAAKNTSDLPVKLCHKIQEKYELWSGGQPSSLEMLRIHLLRKRLLPTDYQNKSRCKVY